MSMPDQIERGIVSWKWTNIAEAQELLNMLISRSRDQVARLPAVRGDMKKMYVESMGTEMSNANRLMGRAMIQGTPLIIPEYYRLLWRILHTAEHDIFQEFHQTVTALTELDWRAGEEDGTGQAEKHLLDWWSHPLQGLIGTTKTTLEQAFTFFSKGRNAKVQRREPVLLTSDNLNQAFNEFSRLDERLDRSFDLVSSRITELEEENTRLQEIMDQYKLITTGK